MRKSLFILLFLYLASVATEARIVKGSVRSGNQKLSGVVVTDGKNFTQTRRNGTFKFDICDSADFVYIVTPSGYIADWSEGSPFFYRKAEGKSYFDFDLLKTEDPSSSYNIVAVGDPQTGSMKDFNEFAGAPFNDLQQCGTTLAGLTVGLALGDITFDVYHLMKNWKETIVKVGYPFYHVIGNHDHNVKFSGDDMTSVTYKEFFGPTNYAFFLGNDVVIALDNIIFHSTGRYKDGYTKEQLEWIKGLMKYVKDDADIYVAQHSPLNGRDYNKMIINHDALLDILKGHKITFLSGHNHTNGVFEYAPGVMEHNIAAICGTWWDTYHCTDGTPSGYKVLTKENGELEWYYKSIGRDRNFQYELFRPGEGRLHPDCVLVNVWDYDPLWTIEWYEDGKPMGKMEQVKEYSPLHAADLKAKYEKIGQEPAKHRHTRQSPHFFAAQPSKDAKTVTIVIKDRFGNEWKEDVVI